jgi:hypothetical protein
MAVAVRLAKQELTFAEAAAACSDEKGANRDTKVWHGATGKGP